MSMDTRLQIVVSDVQRQIAGIPTGKRTSDEVSSIRIVSYMTLDPFRIEGECEVDDTLE